MKKKLLISAPREEEIISNLIRKLMNNNEIIFDLYDPSSDSFIISDMIKIVKNYNLILTKVNTEASIDILYFAKDNNIPMINNLNSILRCKNKVLLDYELRKIINKYQNHFPFIRIPKSWSHPTPINNIEDFKNWVSDKLPIVFKTHDQHNIFVRFNFLAKNMEELDDFIAMYKNLLYFDLYIQEFIDCDGIDRKIYVIGNKVFGIERENPIYLFLREHPDTIDVSALQRKRFSVPASIEEFALNLSKELDLELFGFDLAKNTDSDLYYLLDLNDFPGYKGIPNAANYIYDLVLEKINR